MSFGYRKPFLDFFSLVNILSFQQHKMAMADFHRYEVLLHHRCLTVFLP
ncbi:hypothetical protein ACTQ14_11625 [Oscillospiraceae bacterium LCP21S3_E10]